MRSVVLVVASLACAGQGNRLHPRAKRLGHKEKDREGTVGPHLHALAELTELNDVGSSSSRERDGRPKVFKTLISLFAALSNPVAASPIASVYPGHASRMSKKGNNGRRLLFNHRKHRIKRRRAGETAVDHSFLAAGGLRSTRLRGGDKQSHGQDAAHRINRTRRGFYEQVYQELEPQQSRPGENTTFCVQQVQGTGDCLFHAIAIGIAFEDEGCHLDMYDPSLPERVMALRLLAVDTLTADPDRQLHLEGEEMIGASELVALAAEQYNMTPETYVSVMRKKRVWGGGPEILALANALERPIHVFQPVPVEDGTQLQLQLCCALGSPRFDSTQRVCICAADDKFPECKPMEVKRHGEGGHHFLALLPTYGRALPELRGT